MKILLIALLVLCNTFAFAQTKKFRWNDVACEFEGTYNASKYSEAKLRNTYKLISPGGYPISTDATVFELEDLKKLNVAALDKEYNSKSNELKKLDIVKLPYWEAVRQKKLKELEQVYKLSRATILAHDNPAVLKDHTSAQACIKKYAYPLINGGNELLRAWQQLNEEARKKNADPERVRKKYEQQFNSPNKYKYALIEVMTFGWWNCANNFIEYDESHERHEREFRKLFTRVRTVECEEP
jgi:hypothetical protein